MCKNAVAAKQVIITCSSNKHYICHDITEESDFWKSYSWVDEHSDIYSILSVLWKSRSKKTQRIF